MKKYAGEEFLNKVYKELANSEIVKHSGKGSNKNEDVSLYMDRLDNITSKLVNKDKISKLKYLYYKKYTIKENDIPDSYFEYQKKIALERGYGYLQYTDDLKKKEIEIIIKEQQESLETWIDYFVSKDTEYYPTWFKYYAFQGMIRIGYFDKEKNEFTKRTKSTIKPFIELNREALAMMYDYLVRVLDKEDINDQMLESLLKNGNFSKIYAHCIRKLDMISKDNTNSNEGIWKKYNQGSDPNILFNDIHGKGTGWCTAGGLETATAHLGCGDFYVYFTKNKNDEYVNPRIAIRMEYNRIGEVRGIAENQNLEPDMEKIAQEKLKEFPDGDVYEKKVKDMEMLTYIHTKWRDKQDLTKEDLIFLYEINDKIQGFGYKKDPRVYQILIERTKRKDLCEIFECSEEEIALKPTELNKNTVYYSGTFNVKCLETVGNRLPKYIDGPVWLSELNNAAGLTFPKTISGDLYLSNIESTEGLNLPENIHGDLWLTHLKSAKNLVLPKSILGTLDLGSLESAEDLKLPENLGDGLYLSSLKSAIGLNLPTRIIGALDLRSLESAEGLILPQSIGGNLYLSSLKNIAGLKLPQNIGGDLTLSNLISIENFEFPQNMVIGGNLNLHRLISIKDVKFPQHIKGDLFLEFLESFDNLDLSNITVGSIALNNLKSARNLILPKSINGNLHLPKLINAFDLVLPDVIEGYIDLSGLKSAEGLDLSNIKEVCDYIDLTGLESTDGLIVPEHLIQSVWLPAGMSLDNKVRN